MSFEKLLNTTCTIQEKTDTQGATGEVTSSWATKTAGVACRINSGKNASVAEDIGKRSLVAVKIYFLIDTDIVEGNRIVADGVTYDVILVAQDSSADHLEVQASYVFQD